MSDTDTTKQLTIVERMKQAAYEQSREQYAERNRVAAMVLTEAAQRRGDGIGEIVKLGGDFVVQVVRRGEDPSWTTVVGGEKSTWHFRTQEEAVLHLIARRYDDKDSSQSAAFYAGRILGVPSGDA
jgi:hypothetical protein